MVLWYRWSCSQSWRIPCSPLTLSRTVDIFLTWLFIPLESDPPLGNCPYVVLEIRLIQCSIAGSGLPLWVHFGEVATPRPCLVALQLLSASLAWAGKGTKNVGLLC